MVAHYRQKGSVDEMGICMNGGRNDDVSRYAFRKLAIASVCLPLSVFLLGPVTYVLFVTFALHEFTVGIVFVSVLLLPTGGAICGHVAVRRIDQGPESADNFRRLAMGGTIISYIFALILVSVCVWIAYAVIFDIRLISFH